MNREQLRERTKAFALRVLSVVKVLGRSRIANILGNQVARSGTSIGANYREALRATTDRQFAHRIATVLAESDETKYWLELIGESALVKPSRLRHLIKECDELSAIFGATLKSIRARLNQRSKRPRGDT